MKSSILVITAFLVWAGSVLSSSVAEVDQYLEASEKRVKKAAGVVDLFTAMKKSVVDAGPLIDKWYAEERANFQAVRGQLQGEAAMSLKQYAAKALQCIKGGKHVAGEGLRRHQSRQTQCVSELAEKRAIFELELS